MLISFQLRLEYSCAMPELLDSAEGREAFVLLLNVSCHEGGSVNYFQRDGKFTVWGSTDPLCCKTRKF